MNVGCLPSKHLIRAAESIHKASYSPFKGVQTNKPSWDYKTIIQQKRELVEDLQQHKYMDVVADLENVTLLEGRGRLISRNTIEVNGKTYRGKKSLLPPAPAQLFLPLKAFRK